MAKPLWFAYRHACDLRKVPECPRCMHASPPRLADRAHEKAGTEDNFLLVQWRIDWRIKPRCNRKHLCFGRAHRHCFGAGTPPYPTSACRSMQHRWRSSSIRWYLRIIGVLVNSAQLPVHSITTALRQSAALFQEDITCSVAACDRNHKLQRDSSNRLWLGRSRRHDFETDC